MATRRISVPLLFMAVVLVPVRAGAQNVDVLIRAVMDSADLSVEGEPVRHEGDALSTVFGQDLEAASDYGTVGVSEFSVGREGGRSMVRIYEMIDSAAAFGWFSYRRQFDAPGYEPVVLGAEGYADGNQIVFWQGPFVTELTGPQAISIEAGRVISRTITDPSRLPTVSTLLPAASRVPGSERYLLTPSVIREQFGVDPDVLGFENSVEAASAIYASGNETSNLILFQYPTPQLARLYSDAWLEATGGVRPARLSGLLFGIVASGDAGTFTDSVLSELQSQFNVTWNLPPPDPLTIQQIILTAFTWIGIALLFTIVAGMGFGGLRIYLRRSYPSQLLGGEIETEFLQLNINQRDTKTRLTD